MKTITLFDIEHAYRGLVKEAKLYYKRGDFAAALKYIDHSVTIAQQFNWIYTDPMLESLLDEIASSIIDTSSSKDFFPEEDNWAFFDDYCTSYVLVLQWMRALSKLGKNILYITSEYSFEGRRDICILNEVRDMPNVTVKVIEGGEIQQRANSLFQSIVAHKASRLFLHKAMNSIIQLPLCILPKGIKVYNINLGDQFFWLGTNHIDYNIEFRPFGAAVSHQRRGFKQEQLLMIPFYPANENRPFEGFPAECNGKLIVFSGGDFYKTCDVNGTFWSLVKELLDRHPNIVFLFVIKNISTSTVFLDNFIKRNHFEGRLIYIGKRQDIYQVFAHCDIYMGTCPISGSLMSQLAAINGKPILQYYTPGTPDDETEQALCINEAFSISFSDKELFLKEAERLISDAKYRKEQGERIKSAMMQPSQFDALVAKTLETNKTQREIVFPSVDYRFLEKRWMMLEKMGFTDAGAYLYSLLRKKLLYYSPILYLKIKVHILENYLFHKEK